MNVIMCVQVKVVHKLAPPNVFCHKVAETICVTSSEHSYQHDRPDLALTLWTCL